MYNFIDVTEVSEESILPSEALKINGEYIENQISGYRTLTVAGREALSPDVISQTTGVRDGSFLRSKRYPERIITVTYQLNAKTNEEFREAYNKLAAILDVKNAELIFNDEQDKYFVGTPCIIGEVSPGRNCVVGNFEILCTDPFKYSVTEYEATIGEEGDVIFDYGGTYKSFPKLEAAFYEESEASEDGETAVDLTGSGDCGYVAFFNESEKIIQIGDPDEKDGETAYPKSQTLVNSTFKTNTSWGTAAKAQWSVNNGIVTDSSKVSQTGSIAMGVAKTNTATATSIKTGSKKTKAATFRVSGEPPVRYSVIVTTRDRTATSVKVDVSVSTMLENTGSWFGKSITLTAAINLGGTIKYLVLKKPNAKWVGAKNYIASTTFTLTGLSASQTKISSATFEVDREAGGGPAGALYESLGDILIPEYTTTTTTYTSSAEYYLAPSSFGTVTDFWHGPSITRTIPADQSGEVGAKNLTLTYAQKMSIGSANSATNQAGAFQVLLVSGSGDDRKIVAGVYVYKFSGGKTGKMRFYVNGSIAAEISVDLSYNNKYFTESKTSTITKTGKTVSFDVCGIKRTYNYDAIADMAVNEVTFTMTQYAQKPALSYNGLFWAKLVKNNCETWKDIPNKFSANDVVVADCRSGEIYLNGVLDHRLGALGNDWEGFCLTPGINQIGASYSDWVAKEYAPNFTIRYREVFL